MFYASMLLINKGVTCMHVLTLYYIKLYANSCKKKTSYNYYTLFFYIAFHIVFNSNYGFIIAALYLFFINFAISDIHN